MTKKITPALVKQVIDEWESITDINQYRDVIETKKEENAMYKKVADKINGVENLQ